MFSSSAVRCCGANDRQSGPLPEAAHVTCARSALARRTRRLSVLTRQGIRQRRKRWSGTMSPAKAKKSVGVIGLGIMGGSFARNLIKAGWHVTGFDIDVTKRKELGKAGAEIVRSA